MVIVHFCPQMFDNYIEIFKHLCVYRVCWSYLLFGKFKSNTVMRVKQIYFCQTYVFCGTFIHQIISINYIESLTNLKLIRQRCAQC